MTIIVTPSSLWPSATAEHADRMVDLLDQKGYSAIAVSDGPGTTFSIPQNVWDECLNVVKKEAGVYA